MGMLSKLTKSGIAAKVIGEARKPKNRAKIKRLVGNVTDRVGGRAKSPR